MQRGGQLVQPGDIAALQLQLHLVDRLTRGACGDCAFVDRHFHRHAIGHRHNARGAMDIGAKDGLQPPLQRSGYVRQRFGAGQPCQVWRFLIDQPLPFAPGSGDALAIGPRLHGLYPHFPANAHSQRQAAAIQSPVGRVKIGGDQMMGFRRRIGQRGLFFQNCARPRRQMEFQFHLDGAVGFGWLLAHFASCLRISSNSAARFSDVRG